MFRSRIRRWLVICAPWLLSLGIIFATLCPQGLRPRLADAQVERFGAYFVTASAFVIAYPRRWLAVTLGIAAAAILLELGLLITPGRDAGVPDAIAKALGGVTGALVARQAVVRWPTVDEVVRRWLGYSPT